MDFNDTREEAMFREEVRNWLNDNAGDYRQPLGMSPGDVRFAELGRDWQKKKAKAGYAAISLPKDMGGMGGTAMQEVIFAEEEGRYHVPVGPFVTIGCQLAVPTIYTHGTPEQIEQFAYKTLMGELLWCQMFSEPSAGSDLAGLRTKAVRDGDDWVVNGQKVWTSWAHTADWGVLVVRTDADVPKHKGLTYFLLDMKTPGIDVRPIKQISGESEFNEVFLTDVRIPDRYRLGEVNRGWKVVMTTLMNERLNVGGESKGLPSIDELLDVVRSAGDDAAPYHLDVARHVATDLGLKNFRARLLTSVSRGETPSAMSNMGKLVSANMLQDISAIAGDILGMDCAFSAENNDVAKKFQYGYIWASALRIAGGTDEILRNQIAERVLGLPGDIRVDKDIAFSQLPAGK